MSLDKRSQTTTVPDDYDRLGQLAEAATEGPWYSEASLLAVRPTARALIAACDPATIRSLVAENKALREVDAAARRYLAALDYPHANNPNDTEDAAEEALRAALHHKDGAS